MDRTDYADHTHCELGLFHDLEPIHTHSHCKQCFRMRRCEGSGSSFKLSRCSGCNIATYCSKDCQKKHWRDGHKLACMGYKIFRDRSIQLSGNPNAWSELMQWAEFHHASIINAALACYIHKKDTVPDVTGKYLLHLSLNYRDDDPSLPVEKKFEMRGAHFASKDAPETAALYKTVFAVRPTAVAMGKREMGDGHYWGTGAYLLMVRFRPRQVQVGTDGIPFWKHFGIDRIHARARPACRSPLDQLEENLAEGRKMKFCCGKIEGFPTCCCGGWTHEVSGHPPKSGW